MALEVRVLRRITSWSNWKAAGGVSRAVLALPLSIKASVTLLADRLTLVIPLDSDVASFFSARSIIRIDQSDSVYDEWKIVDRSTDDQAGTITINAASLRSTDLAESGLVERVDSDGVVVHDFETLGLSPADIIDQWIIPALQAAGFEWITAGTITPTAPVDLTFSWDTPLSALLRIAEASKKCELDLRRDGNDGYFIDLVTKVNTSSPTADLRIDKNIVNVQRDENTIDQATRVYPRGMDEDGVHATMARAEWQVTAIVGTIITLADPAGGAGPLQFDDQLNGKYLRIPDGTLTLVSDSDESAETVTVASVTGLSVGDLIQFRADSAGRDMVWLENPVAADPNDGYGIKIAVHDVSDVPGANNLIKNPFMRTWPGTLPPGWTAVGAPTLSKQTAAPYTALGGQGIKVQSTADGQGVTSSAVPVFPTEVNPWVAGYARIWVASGNARVEFVLTTPSGAKVRPLAPNVASNSITGQWEDLGLTLEEAYELGVTAIAIRVVQHGTVASVFYVDSAQLTETPSQQPLVEGSGGTRLWQEANEALRTGSLPIVSYTVPLVDLEAVNPAVFSGSGLIIGADARVRDPKIDIDIATRIVEVNRDYLNPAGASVVLSNKFDDLTDLLAKFRRSGRHIVDTGDTGTGGFDTTALPALSYTITPEGVLTAKVAGSEGTYTTRCLGRLDREPSGDEVDAATQSTPGVRTGLFPSLMTVKAGKRFFLAARAYNKGGSGSVVARVNDVWLGVGNTAGADVIIGTIVAASIQITYPVAFDDECAYCEIWTREFTTNPGGPYSVENLSGYPFRTLSLGADAMMPGVAHNVSIPISAPVNYLMATFVPFDHLGKRGNVQSFRTRGSTGSTGGGDKKQPEDIAAGIELKLDAIQLLEANATGDPINTWDDTSGFANDAAKTDGQPYLEERDGVAVVRFAGNDAMLSPFAVATNPSPASWSLVLAYANTGGTMSGWTPVVAGTDSLWNSFFVAAWAGGLHQARVTWAANTVIDLAVSVVDQFVVVVIRSDLSVGDIDAFLNGTFKGSDAGAGNHSGFGGGLSIAKWTSYFGIHDIAIIWGWPRYLTLVETAQLTALAAERVGIEPDPIDPPDAPDAPVNVVQVSSTSSTVDVEVTMPAMAPDFIRINIGGISGTRIYDVAVTVGDSGVQTITIEGLEPDSVYSVGFQSVAGGIASVGSFAIYLFTSRSSGTLDAPTITSVTYNAGDQSFGIHFTRGANNPLDTIFIIEYDDVPSNGFYTPQYEHFTQSTTLLSDFAQIVGADAQRYFRVWGHRLGWTDSARSNAMAGTAPDPLS